MVNDQVADLFTRIRNAQLARHKSVRVTASDISSRLLELLKREGYIQGFETKEEEEKFTQFEVTLKYYSNGEPAITIIRRVSKSGRRVYAGVDKLPRVLSGLGVAIVSTSEGIMTDQEARKKNIGGEVLACVG